jgi:hypothetical protein
VAKKVGKYDVPLPVDEAELHTRLDPYGGYELKVGDEVATISSETLNDDQLASLLQ